MTYVTDCDICGNISLCVLDVEGGKRCHAGCSHEHEEWEEIPNFSLFEGVDEPLPYEEYSS